MFTGIIEDCGEIARVGGASLSVLTRLDDIRTGDSVAVNGICLTVTTIAPKSDLRLVSFDYSPETARRTGIAGFAAGERVNIERALKLGGRLGGHFLSGHVEATGTIAGIRRSGESWEYTFTFPTALGKYLAEKGSVGIDGISLTVASRDSERFSVAVIPHTLRETTLGFKKPGDTVNLEPDILAKYVENILKSEQKETPLTRDFLKTNGFI